MRTGLVAGITAVLSAAAPVVGASGATITDEARALIALTRETRATYTVISANQVHREGEELAHEWAAEFHDGIQHRVETPRDRIVADCEAKTGTYFGVETLNVISESGVAGAACGVNDNATILAARTTGLRDTAFGPATHLIVVDDQFVRTYDVASDGAILGQTIRGRDGSLKLVSRAVYYKSSAPDGIFSIASLARTAVPENMRKSR